MISLTTGRNSQARIAVAGVEKGPAMLRRFLLIGLVAAAETFPLGGVADANTCLLLKRQMAMFQASREISQYHRVRGLFDRSCTGSQREAVFARATPTLTRSRPAP